MLVLQRWMHPSTFIMLRAEIYWHTSLPQFLVITWFRTLHEKAREPSTLVYFEADEVVQNLVGFSQTIFKGKV
jgi:hypothetical protein